jgi:hypothetical protein
LCAVGLADERAFHLLPDALNGAAADAALAGNLQHAFAGAQLSLDALFKRGIDPRPTELLALRYGALRPALTRCRIMLRSNSGGRFMAQLAMAAGEPLWLPHSGCSLRLQCQRLQ